MTITLNSDYDVTLSTALLGYVGETNARPVSVEGLTVDGADRYVLTIDYGDGVQYEVDITGGQWTPTADVLRSAQTVSCQICAKKLSGDEYILVKKSRIFRLRIGAAIGDNAIPSPGVAMDALDRIDAIGRQVAADRKAAETAAQTAQAVADSLPDDYVTAVGKIAENTAEIANVKLTDKELQRRVNALYDMGNGITHQFETDTDTAYQKVVPTGGKLMSVKSVGGKSVVWNQLVKPVPTAATQVGVKFTFSSDGIVTLSGTATTTGNAVSLQSVKNQKGHKYLMFANPLSDFYGVDKLMLSSQSFGRDTTGQGVIITNESSNAVWYYTIYVYEGVTYDNVKIRPQIFDLTTMFGSGNEPSTVGEFRAMFPNNYYPYNTDEIISADTESIIEQGANLYYGTDMLKCGSDDYEYIANSYRCKAIKLKPNTTYTLSFTSDKTSEIILLMNVNTVVNSQPCLDFRKTSDNRSYRTGDNGCLYVGVYVGNGSVMSADVVKRLSECEIMISEGDTPTAYAPYHSNVYQIPEAIKALPGYGWSAGTAKNYVDYENKKYVQCVDSVDLGALNWVAGSTGKVNFQTSQVIGQKLTKSYSIAPNFMCLKYSTKTQDELWGKPNVIGITAAANVDGFVYVNDTSYTDVTAFKQAMQGVILYYELETPIVTDISSLIPDDFLRNLTVEAGGSVTFKGGNDDYRIPVPSEEEYIVRLSEVGGTT